MYALPLRYRVMSLCMHSRVKREAWSEQAVLEFNDSIKLNLLLDFCLFYQLFTPKVGIEVCKKLLLSFSLLLGFC